MVSIKEIKNSSPVFFFFVKEWIIWDNIILQIKQILFFKLEKR